MTDETFAPLSLSSNRTTSGTKPTGEDFKVGYELASKCSSTSEAIRTLLDLNWNTSSICSILTTKSGKNIPPQFVANVRNRPTKK